MLAQFVEAVSEDKPVEPYGATFFDDLRAAQVAEAVAEAACSGRRVDVEKVAGTVGKRQGS
jgi:hypothetical protein